MADVNLAMVQGPKGSRFAKLAVVKRLRVGVADDPEFVTMLVDEARITANLRHPNVVQLFEVNVEGGRPFLAMEYLDGISLTRLRERGRKAETLTRDLEYVIVTDILAGLHHAHELTGFDGTRFSLVHRDVTPHNVIITVDGFVKVLDFGIAKAIGSAAITQQGVVKGKLRYMSPEQARGAQVDRRADIFSVGIILWEAATGRRFWDHYPEGEWIGHALLAGAYRASPRSVDPTVPEALDAICARALALDPNERYATAEEFRVELENFIGDRGILGRRKLGPLVTTLAERERKILKSIIEEAASDTSPPPGVKVADVSSDRHLAVAVGDDVTPNDATRLMPGAPGRGAPESHAGHTVLMQATAAPSPMRSSESGGPESWSMRRGQSAPVKVERRYTEVFVAAALVFTVVCGLAVIVGRRRAPDAHGQRQRSEVVGPRLGISRSSDSFKYERSRAGGDAKAASETSSDRPDKSPVKTPVSAPSSSSLVVGSTRERAPA